jgi:phage shock protein PspC (stress-responsive transcriptional regulator)
MKKNISINLQGIIFHIEEDGYEVLSRYLAEVKAHFSGYRGHEEIVADIESRIAELFTARLSGTKQVISLEDVQAMTAKMGRVSDFQSADEAEDDDELLADAVASGTAAGTYTKAGIGDPDGPFGKKGAFGPEGTFGKKGAFGPDGPLAAGTEADSTEPRRLFRDMTNRKVAGVAAGIARYFAINPLWVRLGFIGLLILVPLAFNDLGWLEELGEKLAALSVISYIILWIALPKRYDTPTEQEDRSYRKLYRDVDNGKVSGVSAGLAAYLNTDVTLVRILFIVGLFAGGISFILYPLLWALVPTAKTISDKMRMRGDAITLSGIDSNVRSSYTEEGAPGNKRLLGSFFEDLAKALNPLLTFVGSAIRIFAGLLLTIIGFTFLLSFIILLGVGLGLIPESDNIVMGAMPAYVFLNGVSPWAVLCFFLMVAIPALALLLAGIGLLLRRTVLHRSVSLSLLGLWLLGIVGSSIAGARLAREYQRRAEIIQTQTLTPLTAKRLVLERRWTDVGEYVDLDLIPVDSGQVPRLERVLSARGATEDDARRTAGTSILHTLDTPNDSTLVIDDHFSYQPGARYRNQRLRLRLLLPRDRTFRMNESFSEWLNADQYVNGQAPYNADKHTFRLSGSRIECVDCASEDLRGTDNNDETTSEDNSDVNLDFGSASTFSTDESSYGDGRRSFDGDDFDHVSVTGPFQVVIRANDNHSVRAAGNEADLSEIIVERNGNELVIRPRRKSLTGSNWRSYKKILITIGTPELNKLELVGAAQAVVNGFSNGNLEVEQAGASLLRLNGSFSALDLELAGGCRAILEGEADDLNVDGAGGCELAAAKFTTQRANISMIGASKARLKVTESLEADAVGASVIEYSGKPTSVSKDATGASRVEPVEE